MIPKMLRFLPVLLVLALLVSCKSSPVSSKTPDTGSQAALDAAAGRLDTARQRAADFGGPRFLEDDWGAAEARYSRLQDAAPGTPEEDRDRITARDALAADYDSIFERALPQYAEVRALEVTEARADALDAGVLLYAPERLEAADAIAVESLRLYREDEDYYGAKNGADRAETMYKALTVIALARNEAFEIEFYQFDAGDPDGCAQADQRLENAFAAWDSGDTDTALQAAAESLALYHAILNTGMHAYADGRRGSAQDERQAALDSKADVAVRLDFENAGRIFTLGESEYAKGEYREAADLYFQAEFSFAAAASVAEIKRQRALEAIRRAETAAAASGEAARNANLIAGEEVEP